MKKFMNKLTLIGILIGIFIYILFKIFNLPSVLAILLIIIISSIGITIDIMKRKE